MPSPFPGMNPYLERDVASHDFHERFIILGAGMIGSQVRPNYIVKIDEHISIHELGDESRRLLGRADLGLTPTRWSADPAPGGGLLEAPARIRLPDVDVEREAFVEIRDRHSQELITVLELLSPSNKRAGPDRDQYLAKRGQVLASPAHLVEVDLLRGGEPMPARDRPDCVYSVLVSRAEERPSADFWPIGLRAKLPVIRIPLRHPHPDATLDLQGLLQRVYNEAGYEFYIYEGQPQPPLSAEDLAWAQGLVPHPP
jgi:hypothetical protein